MLSPARRRLPRSSGRPFRTPAPRPCGWLGPGLDRTEEGTHTRGAPTGFESEAGPRLCPRYAPGVFAFSAAPPSRRPCLDPSRETVPLRSMLSPYITFRVGNLAEPGRISALTWPGVSVCRLSPGGDLSGICYSTETVWIQPSALASRTDREVWQRRLW